MKKIIFAYFLIFQSYSILPSSFSFQSGSSMASTESALDFAQATQNAKLRKKNNGGTEDCDDSTDEKDPEKKNSNFRGPFIAIMIGLIICYNLYGKSKDSSNSQIII